MDLVRQLHERVRAALLRPELRPLDGRVLVACSGGPDSRTLLEALAALKDELQLSLAVACVDHGLRPEARLEARAVEAVATDLGLPSVTLEVQVARPSMALCRRARYDALLAEAKRRAISTLAVAHTATDQAETLIDRLVRGAGVRGLSAMARVRPAGPGVRLIRPLLDVTAGEIEEYVRLRGLEVARDPTNLDRHYRRSRVRHEVLPLLRRERGDLDRALAALCERLRADADALEAIAERALLDLTIVDERGPSLRAAELAALPDAIAARVVARASGIALEAVHIEAVRRLCLDRNGTRSIDLPGGLVAERRYDRLRFGPRAPDPGDVEVQVPAPGAYRLLGADVELTRETFGALSPGGALLLRNLRRGDHAGSGRASRLLIDRKVPRPLRRWLPILVRRTKLRDEVLWIPGVFGSGPVLRALTVEGAVQ
ncbi:MAG TPA: tRNA lysidine(34) synthetase TilS [Polyangia bacterium]